MDRPALQRIARTHKTRLLTLKADRRYLWQELGDNRALLVLLPADLTYHPEANAFIPLAWDRAAQRIELLDGQGQIQRIEETDFFARRLPLRHAALALLRTDGLRRREPSRDQQLLLDDFWYSSRNYRHRMPRRVPVLQTLPPDADAPTLIQAGNRLLRQEDYSEAISVFRAALNLEPDSPEILNSLAFSMLYGGGELLPALALGKRALEMDPSNPLILETVGGINLRLGYGLRAVRYFQLAWAYARHHSPEVQIAIMDQLTLAWIAAQRLDRALPVAEFRRRTYPRVSIPREILLYFPSLLLPPDGVPPEDPDAVPPP